MRITALIEEIQLKEGLHADIEKVIGYVRSDEMELASGSMERVGDKVEKMADFAVDAEIGINGLYGEVDDAFEVQDDLSKQDKVELIQKLKAIQDFCG